MFLLWFSVVVVFVLFFACLFVFDYTHGIIPDIKTKNKYAHVPNQFRHRLTLLEIRKTGSKQDSLQLSLGKGDFVDI